MVTELGAGIITIIDHSCHLEIEKSKSLHSMRRSQSALSGCWGRKVLLTFVRIAGGMVFGFIGWMTASGFIEELSLPQLQEIGAEASAAIILGIGGFFIIPYLIVYPVQRVVDSLSRVSTEDLVAGGVGLLIAAFATALLTVPLSRLPSYLGNVTPAFAAIALGYLCVLVLVSRQRDFRALLPARWRLSDGGAYDGLLLLDTSAIIDGRIADISETGFLPGRMAVPRFVLEELQHVADSPDSQRRGRGRRGLELLDRLQRDTVHNVQILDSEIADANGVDTMLVRLAKELNASIVTSDFNLNRVASLQGVRALNINELANALRAVFLPGEEFTIRISQEGKEFGQGVGYLDDGTMVVVEDARRLVGAEVDAVVTRVLQTSAGRMVFAHLSSAQ
jgi:uncharacterized protein YacL